MRQRDGMTADAFEWTRLKGGAKISFGTFSPYYVVAMLLHSIAWLEITYRGLAGPGRPEPRTAAGRSVPTPASNQDLGAICTSKARCSPTTNPPSYNMDNDDAKFGTIQEKVGQNGKASYFVLHLSRPCLLNKPMRECL